MKTEEIVICPVCHGVGVVNIRGIMVEQKTESCRACGGTGRVVKMITTTYKKISDVKKLPNSDTFFSIIDPDERKYLELPK